MGGEHFNVEREGPRSDWLWRRYVLNWRGRWHDLGVAHDGSGRGRYADRWWRGGYSGRRLLFGQARAQHIYLLLLDRIGLGELLIGGLEPHVFGSLEERVETDGG